MILMSSRPPSRDPHLWIPVYTGMTPNIQKYLGKGLFDQPFRDNPNGLDQDGKV